MSNLQHGNSIATTLRLLVSTLFSHLGWRVVLTLVLMVVVSLTEGLAILLLLPLMQLVGLNIQGGSAGRLAGLVSATISSLGIGASLVSVLLIFVAVTAAHAALSRWQTVFNLKLVQDFTSYQRQRLYRAIANSNWLFFCRARASDFTHALTTEVDRVGLAAHYVLSLLATAAITVVYVSLALRLSVVITTLVVLSGGVLLLLLRSKTRVARASGEEHSVLTRELYAASIEHLGGLKTARSYGAVERSTTLFSKLTRRLSRTYLDAVRGQANVAALFKIGSVIILSLILYVSVTMLALPTAGVLLLLFLFYRIIPQFSSFQDGYQQLVHDLPAFRAVLEMQTRCEAAAEVMPATSKAVELRTELACARVSFSYGHGEPDVLSDLNITIRAGQTTAIVGPSGAGKSTVADLIMGLIHPTQGAVLVDGLPLDPEHTQSWRDKIGYVAQDTFLFHDTIRANLSWANPDSTEQEMFEALRQAAAEEFVAALPDGIETFIGDRGVRLSGGERQRLALARALLRGPQLLILDEATSALDSENEQRIQQSIERLRGDMTILVITHRLSTIRDADVIYVLDGGRVVERGDWDELLATKDSHFGMLHKAQSLDNREESEALNLLQSQRRHLPLGRI